MPELVILMGLQASGKSTFYRERLAETHMPTIADKNELLFARGVNYNDLPTWQRRGAAVRWEVYEKAGYNPQTQKTVMGQRRRMLVDEDLPMKDAYADYIRAILATAQTEDET